MKVIVTAAASGIGHRIATRFASEGASVFIGDRDVDALATAIAETPGIDGAVVDLGSHEEVAEFIAKAMDKLGGIDVLINNVGIAGPTALLENVTPEEWDHTMRLNLGSHFYCSREVIPKMKHQRSGLIINISSIAGQFGYPFHGPYAISKAGVIALMNTLAMELGPFNVRVNTICPCAVNGPRIDSVMEVEAENSGIPLDLVREAFLTQNSMRRFIEADDVAALAYFLATDQARMITGQEIAVDGNAETIRLPVRTWELAE